jgi:beta-glucuronidase
VTFGSNKLVEDRCLDFVDVISFNTYPAWYGEDQDQFFEDKNITTELRRLEEFANKPENRNKALLISEIGAEALPGLHGGQRWSEEYQADLQECVVRYVLASERYSGALLWQFCDSRTYIGNTAQMRAGGFNHKGLVDRHRNPKESFRRISKILN